VPLPRQLASKFIPNLGDAFEVGLAGVGVSVVDTTLAANTAMTDAQLIAGPPNTRTDLQAFGPVVHSLGIAPTVVLVQPRIVGGDITGLALTTGYAFMTADASAGYFRARSFTGTGPGVSVRMIFVR